MKKEEISPPPFFSFLFFIVNRAYRGSTSRRLFLIVPPTIEGIKRDRIKKEFGNDLKSVDVSS